MGRPAFHREHQNKNSQHDKNNSAARRNIEIKRSKNTGQHRTYGNDFSQKQSDLKTFLKLQGRDHRKNEQSRDKQNANNWNGDSYRGRGEQNKKIVKQTYRNTAHPGHGSYRHSNYWHFAYL